MIEDNYVLKNVNINANNSMTQKREEYENN